MRDSAQNNKLEEVDSSAKILDNDRKQSNNKTLRKHLSIDAFSDSSSDESHGGGYKRLSNSFYRPPSAHRKRTHNEMFNQSRPYYRDNNYRNFRSSKYNANADRSPRDHDHYAPPSKRARYSTFNNSNFSSHFTFESSIPSYNSVIPRMNNFKDFVLTLDDHVSPEEAINAYYGYVKMFSDEQLDPFFKNYKQCDWLILKYHPVWKQCESSFIRKCFQIRLHVFLTLHKQGLMDGLVLDSNANDVYRKLRYFLIFLNILLECGNMDEVSACKDALLERHSNENPTSIEKDENGAGDVQHEGKFVFDENPPKHNSDNLDLVDDGFNQENLRSNHSSECNVNGRHHIIGFNIRAIPVDASRDEIYNTYKDIDGFLRVYVSEPNLGRKDFRRAYISFKSDGDVRAITDKINSTKFRENTSLYVRPNHELTRRVKCEELKKGHNHTHAMIIHDVHYVYELIEKLDNKYTVFNKVDPIDKDFLISINTEITPEDAASLATTFDKIVAAYEKLLSAEDTELFNKMELPSKNPILMSLRELHEQLLSDPSQTTDLEAIKRHLDPAILYLRIVYSIDYYALTDYPYEHLRNVRCSTITIRSYGDSNESKEADSLLNIDEQILKVTETDSFESYKSDTIAKFGPLIEGPDDEDSASSVTELKDADKEIESFIQANTQRITDEKFLCPLSMKKFKSPEYVRKHILTKHSLQLLNIGMDVVYFNNFVKSRFKNLPFSINSFKKRTRTNGDITQRSFNLTRGFEAKPDSLNVSVKDLSLHSADHSHLRNPKSYGRYRDVDTCSSMFDL